MSHSDFDVVTGPSMAQRRMPLPQPSGKSPEAVAEAAMPPPAAAPREPEEKRP